MAEKFSASNAAKHMACHASANLELAIPGFVHPPRIIGGAADKGSEAHEVFEKLMNYTAAELRAWINLLEYIQKLRSTRRFKVLTEVTVKATWLPPDPVTGEVPQTTVDLVLYTQDEIHVIDLKWGTIIVDVIDNDQLLYYATCFVHLAPKAKGVTLHIVQPRANNLSPWYVSSTELKAWQDKAIATQQKIHAKDLTFGPSDHCKFCPAYPHSRGAKGNVMCPATMKLLYPAPYDEDAILELD